MMRMNQSGFTLPEVLVLGAALLVFVVFSSIFLHPHDYAAANRNAQRRLEMAVVMQGVRAYHSETGHLPSSITTKSKLIGSASDAANLCTDLVRSYLNAMPRDPLLGKPETVTNCNQKNTNYVTGFAIERTADGQHVMLMATLSEAGEQIMVKY